jgi:hypothetical protein
MTLSVSKISSAAVDDKYIESWWNDNDRKKLKYLGKNLSPYHFFHKKFHKAYLVNELGPPCGERPATIRLSNGMANMYRRRKEVMMKDEFVVVWNEDVEVYSRNREKRHEIYVIMIVVLTEIRNRHCPEHNSRALSVL